eukprot:1136170-Pelagomonas_calceolata.AAC.2
MQFFDNCALCALTCTWGHLQVSPSLQSFHSGPPSSPPYLPLLQLLSARFRRKAGKVKARNI